MHLFRRDACGEKNSDWTSNISFEEMHAVDNKRYLVCGIQSILLDFMGALCSFPTPTRISQE